MDEPKPPIVAARAPIVAVRRPIVAAERQPIVASRVDGRGHNPETGRENAEGYAPTVAGRGSPGDGGHAAPGRKPVEEKGEPEPPDYSDVLSHIFRKFAQLRKKDKIKAWVWLQDALAENAHKICPDVMSIKDLIAAQANIEDMLKGAGGTQGESPSDYLRNWLSGGPEKAVQ